MDNIKNIIQSSEYDFLRNNKNLNKNIILLGLGGSHSYGTSNENSDIDIRGVATNSKRNILIGEDFEQVVDTNTDTTIYSFNKVIKLLCACNPNIIEMLGLKPEHYIYLSDIGKELIKNKSLFLSKRAIYSFGGYANAQLRRMENKSVRFVNQSQREKYILKSIEYANEDFKRRYYEMPNNAISFYIDKSERDDYDTEIFCDVSLKHYPLRDFKGIFSEVGTVLQSYSKIGKRNEKAIQHNKIGKHMCHLIRLYLMCFDILEKGEINTYRDKEHDFLMKIRNGGYLDDNNQPTKEFYEIVDEYENKFDKLRETTDLPNNVDMNKISDFVEMVNEMVVLGKNQ